MKEPYGEGLASHTGSESCVASTPYIHGKSRMRECRTLGSARGTLGNRRQLPRHFSGNHGRSVYCLGR